MLADPAAATRGNGRQPPRLRAALPDVLLIFHASSKSAEHDAASGPASARFAVSDRTTLGRLTQFDCPDRSQVVDYKYGEMSEWLKEHAWKAIFGDVHRATSKRFFA